MRLQLYMRNVMAMQRNSALVALFPGGCEFKPVVSTYVDIGASLYAAAPAQCDFAQADALVEQLYTLLIAAVTCGGYSQLFYPQRGIKIQAAQADYNNKDAFK